MDIRMRKITYESAMAFMNDEKFNCGNTYVEDGRFYLHAKLIAEKISPTQICVSNCGYPTQTTYDRLNAIVYFWTKGNYRISRKKGGTILHWKDGKYVESKFVCGMVFDKVD